MLVETYLVDPDFKGQYDSDSRRVVEGGSRHMARVLDHESLVNLGA